MSSSRCLYFLWETEAELSQNMEIKPLLSAPGSLLKAGEWAVGDLPRVGILAEAGPQSPAHFCSFFR